MREDKTAEHRRDVERIRAYHLEKGKRRSRRGNRGEVDDDVRLAFRRRSRRDSRGERIHARRIAVEIDRRTRAERKRSKAASCRRRRVLVEPVELRIVADDKRTDEIALPGERCRTAARHCERSRRAGDGVDGNRNRDVEIACVDRAAVRADIDIEPRAVPVGDQSRAMDIVGLERAAVEVDRERSARHFVLDVLRHERSAVQIQYSVSVRTLRPFAGTNRYRSAVLRERRRSAGLRAEDKVAVQRPVATGLLSIEVVCRHIAGACDVRIRGIKVALVEIDRLCRRNADGAEFVDGIVVQVVKDETPRHVILDGVFVAAVCCIATDGQMPRLQRYRIEARGRAGATVAYANEILIVIAGVSGVVERIFVLPVEAPVSAIGYRTEAQPRMGRFGDIRRKVDDVAFVA